MAAEIAPSTRRGLLRREIRLSARRLEALLTGRNMEVTLERTIVALRMNAEGESWANQLNVGAGIGGGTALNRVAVDVARLTGAGKQLRLSLNELKAWRSNEPPRAAVEELFAYGPWLALLRPRAVVPYNRQPWPQVDHVDMHLMAPAAYFARHGGVAATSSVLRSAETELEALRSRHAELRAVSFAPGPIVLRAGIGAAEFLNCFNSSAIRALVRTGSAAASPLDVLRTDKASELRAWVHDWLARVGRN